MNIKTKKITVKIVGIIAAAAISVAGTTYVKGIIKNKNQSFENINHEQTIDNNLEINDVSNTLLENFDDSSNISSSITPQDENTNTGSSNISSSITPQDENTNTGSSNKSIKDKFKKSNKKESQLDQEEKYQEFVESKEDDGFSVNLDELRNKVDELTEGIENYSENNEDTEFIDASIRGVPVQKINYLHDVALPAAVGGTVAVVGYALYEALKKRKTANHFNNYYLSKDYAKNVNNLLVISKNIEKNKLKKAKTKEDSEKYKKLDADIKILEESEKGIFANIYSIATGDYTPTPQDIKSNKYLKKYVKNNFASISNTIGYKNTKIAKKLSKNLKVLESQSDNSKKYLKASKNISDTLKLMSFISGNGKVLLNKINNNNEIYSESDIKNIKDFSSYLKISDAEMAHNASKFITKSLKNKIEKSSTLKNKVIKDPTFNDKYFGYQTTINDIPINSARYISGNFSKGHKDFFDKVYLTHLHNDKTNYQTTLNVLFKDSKEGSFVCAFDNKEGLDLMIARVIKNLPVEKIEKVDIVEKAKSYDLRRLKTKTTTYNIDSKQFEELVKKSEEKVLEFNNLLGYKPVVVIPPVEEKPEHTDIITKPSEVAEEMERSL